MWKKTMSKEWLHKLQSFLTDRTRRRLRLAWTWTKSSIQSQRYQDKSSKSGSIGRRGVHILVLWTGILSRRETWQIGRRIHEFHGSQGGQNHSTLRGGNLEARGTLGWHQVLWQRRGHANPKGPSLGPPQERRAPDTMHLPFQSLTLRPMPKISMKLSSKSISARSIWTVSSRTCNR